MTAPIALLLLAALALPALSKASPPPQQQPQTSQSPQTSPSPQQPAFDVVSIHLSPPDHGFTTISPPGAAEFRATVVSMQFLLSMAFDVNTDQILNAPAWASSTLYDVTARAPEDAGLTYPKLLPYLQTLLRDRFGLHSHFEQREVPGYALVVAKGGPKLPRPANPTPAANSTTGFIDTEGLRGTAIPLKTLASMLRSPVGVPVVDATGLNGNFDVTLKFSNPHAAGNDTASDPTLPSIFTAVTEQLGLRLNPRKVSLPFLVIDHVEKLPSAN